jgi:hypothetical protein
LDLGIHNKSKIWIHQEQHETLKAWNRKFWKWIMIPILVPITKSLTIQTRNRDSIPVRFLEWNWNWASGTKSTSRKWFWLSIIAQVVAMSGKRLGSSAVHLPKRV